MTPQSEIDAAETYEAGGSSAVRRGFDSDTTSGIHPAVIGAIIEANKGHAASYGDDPWTAKAEKVIAGHFGAPCTVSVVFNGTGANIVGLAAVCYPYSAIICASSAHIATSETGAVEHAIGAKIVSIPTSDGKLTPELVHPYLCFGNEHHSETRVISISNLTELGTVYNPAEVAALAEFAHANGVLLHMDGARISNAAASLGCSIADLTGLAGVDVLSFGGTKNALLCGDAVVFSKRVDASRVRFIRKQNLQLSAKQRFISAQLLGLFEGDVWHQCACQANDMAEYLEKRLESKGFEMHYPRGGNEVFALLPKEGLAELQEQFHFSTWIEGVRPGFDSVRWVCSFDTTPQDVDALVAALPTLLL